MTIAKISFNCILNDTHRENKPTNKTEALATSMSMFIWVIGKSNNYSSEADLGLLQHPR